MTEFLKWDLPEVLSVAQRYSEILASGKPHNQIIALLNALSEEQDANKKRFAWIYNQIDEETKEEILLRISRLGNKYFNSFLKPWYEEDLSSTIGILLENGTPEDFVNSWCLGPVSFLQFMIERWVIKDILRVSPELEQFMVEELAKISNLPLGNFLALESPYPLNANQGILLYEQIMFLALKKFLIGELIKE